MIALQSEKIVIEQQRDNAPTFREVEEVVLKSLDRLKEKDFALLEADVSERAITHKLAEYIQSALPDRNVDCEYNRNLEAGEQAPKRIHLLTSELEEELEKTIDEDARSSRSTYPDIIVHKRKCNTENLLVVEVKKANNPLGNTFDFLKLAAFTVNEEFEENQKPNRYNYSFGVFILIYTGYSDPAQPELTWFIKGEQIDKAEGVRNMETFVETI